MDTNQMVETIKSSFLFSFHTGNVLVDTLITGLIVMFTTYLLNLVTKLTEIDPKALYLSWFPEEETPENKIIISGKQSSDEDSYSKRQEFSTTFLALVHQIKKLDCEKAEIRELSEIKIKDFANSYYDSDDDEEDDNKKDTTADLIVSQSEEFKLAENIEAVVHTSAGEGEGSGEKKTTLKTEEFQITIKSSVLSMDTLRTVINGWIKEYEESMKPDEYLRYFCYIPSEDAEREYYDATSNYSEFRFESNKRFDNVFFPEREDIMKRLDFFANNKDWYKTRGIPYTMGFLFYGVPGCGKTSTIKAIANYTQRHIVSVPLNGIKTAKELLSIFYGVKMNKKYIPLNKRLYILEDIDCDALKDIVGDRANKTESDDEEDEEGVNLSLLNSIKAPNMKKVFGSGMNRLTLAGLLEVLDGVMEMDGRMLIITTNYPERLDKALIRPGRIDIKLKFAKCTAETLVQMYEHFFQATLPDRFKTTLPDQRWTPAEATQVFLNHMHNPPEGLTYLITSKPKDSTDIKALVLSRQSSVLEKQDTIDNAGGQPKTIINKLNQVAEILEMEEEDS